MMADAMQVFTTGSKQDLRTWKNDFIENLRYYVNGGTGVRFSEGTGKGADEEGEVCDVQPALANRFDL